MIRWIRWVDAVWGRRTLLYARISRGTCGTAATAIAKTPTSEAPRNRILRVDRVESIMEEKY
jgi:hypothetical protein